MGISKLDTVKDKDGKRFRVAEVQTVDGQIVAVLKGIHPDGSPRRGGARNVRADVLERDYTRIDLPPVTIRKIDDLSEEEKPVVKEPTPSEKAAQIEKEAVRELSKKDIEKAVEAATFGGKVETPETNAKDIDQYKKRVTNLMQMTYDLRKDIEILKAELKDRVRENIDLKKTISKMQQQHEAEVSDLQDRIMEAEAEANAAKKRKEEILKERTEYADALDNDSVAFDEILSLAETIQLVSTASSKLAKHIIAKTEGRI